MKRLIVACSLFLFMFSACDSPLGDLSSDPQQGNDPDKIATRIPPDTPPAEADSIRKAMWQDFRLRNGSEWQIRWSKTTGLRSRSFPERPRRNIPVMLNKRPELLWLITGDCLA